MFSSAISRRRALQLLGAAAGSSTLGFACAPIGSPTATSPTYVSTAAGSGTPKAGGSLIYGQLAPVLNTLPYPGNASTNLLRSLIFNPLVSLDSTKKPVPKLAESWALSDDRLTLTLNLRQGVTFHSGRPFGANEAKWNIEYAQDPKNGAQSGSELKSVVVSAIDSMTLELKFPDVMPHIFSLLADVQIMDPQSDIKVNAAGTGPFKLSSMTPGVEVHVVRNPQYWRRDRPYLDGITIKILPDPSSALVNLEAGAVGMVQVRNSDVPQLQGEAGIDVYVAPAAGSYALVMNTADPPFNDKRVRQAMDLALDRKRYSDTLLFGLADPTYILWPKDSPAWDAALDMGEFNLDKARRLIADSGYPNGFHTKIQASNAYPEEVQFDQIYQADLASIGVTASIEPLEAAQTSAMQSQAAFPALLSGVYGYADADPAMAFTAPQFRPGGNAERFRSDDYEQLVESARHERDAEKRITQYKQIASFIKDQAFVLPLANYIAAYGMRSNVNGVTRQALVPYPALEDVWVA